MGNLNELVLDIETRLATVDDMGGNSVNSVLVRETACRNILSDLERVHAAQVKFQAGTHVLAMAGIRVSCTSGNRGLLSAWCRKAKRELQQQTEGA